MSEFSSAELLAKYRHQGDEQAAAEIFRRYIDRLTRLARSRLAARLMQRIEPDDVVQSAYRSFFLGARTGRFVWQRSGDLWRLLATITLRKVYRHARRHSADKRAVSRECSLGEWSSQEAQRYSREPTPEEAAAVAEELEQLMSRLSTIQCRILELRLQGYAHEEIAAEIKCSERTVRRTLGLIRRQLQKQLPGNGVQPE